MLRVDGEEKEGDVPLVFGFEAALELLCQH